MKGKLIISNSILVCVRFRIQLYVAAHFDSLFKIVFNIVIFTNIFKNFVIFGDTFKSLWAENLTLWFLATPAWT